MRRFILTGTPGAGKTTLIKALAARGVATVPEAATDLITARPGIDQADQSQFLEEIAALQRTRLDAARGDPQVHDRSAVCTLALARLFGLAPPPGLAAELARIAREQPYDRRVFFIANLGFVEPTPVRRISFDDALVFERLHREAYMAQGFELEIIPAAPIKTRLALILDRIT